MASTGTVTNMRSMNGIISYNDGQGGVLEDGILRCTTTNSEFQYTDRIETDELKLDTKLDVVGFEITPTWLSYLYGLTGNIQGQLDAVPDPSGSNVWTGTNTFMDFMQWATTTSTWPTYDSITLGAVYGWASYAYAITFMNSNSEQEPTESAFVWGKMSSATSASAIMVLNNNGDLGVTGDLAVTGDNFFTGDTYISGSLEVLGSVTGVTKSMVGLGNVDNISDIEKPVSSAQQTALNLKANLASPTFTGTVSGITKSMVGLGNVDNISDIEKPVSTAQQTALNAKLSAYYGTTTGNSYLMYTNSGTNLPLSSYFNSQQFMAIGTNLLGHAEGEFVHTGFNYNVLGQKAFSWRIMTSETTSNELMSLTKGGDLQLSSGLVNYSTMRSPQYEMINDTSSTIPSYSGMYNNFTGYKAVDFWNINENGYSDSKEAFQFYSKNGSNSKLLFYIGHNGDVSMIEDSVLFGDYAEFYYSVTASTVKTNNLTGISGTMTISNTSPIAINSSGNITMQNGNVLIENDGDILSKSYTDNTGVNKIESTGITCNNLTVSNSVTLPTQLSLMCCRSSCRLKCLDGTYYLENNTGFVISPSNGAYVYKIETGCVTLHIGVGMGISSTNFFTSMQGTNNAGTVGAETLITCMWEKSAFYNSGSLHSYTMKINICRTNAPTTKIDIGNSGFLDVMVFW